MRDEKKINELARNIMDWAQSTLIVNLRFIDSAIDRLKLQTYEGRIATDARTLFYDPVYILKRYKSDANLVNAAYMHSILHCVLRHYKNEGGKDRTLWNLACDISVEAIIGELNLSCLQSERGYEQRRYIENLKEEIGILNAKKIYLYYQEKNLSEQELKKIHSKFYVDEHFLWYEEGPQEAEILKVKGKNIESQESRTISSETLEGLSDTRSGIDKESGSDQIDESWDKIAKKMLIDIETFSKSRGEHAGSIIQNLKSLSRQRYDYSEFLKKFAALSESIRLNDEEFDYIFYSHGLELYGNVPLIEPLEYKEEESIREFVIAIDTSASVSGELVQKFLEKTYNILKQEESFSNRVNIRILQCDSSIQEEFIIRKKSDFDAYLKTMRLKGFGSTDFRPVFEHVDQLIEEKELKDLKGLLYFTDGHGYYPSKKPSYKVAFVFVDDDGTSPEVPVWAIKLALESEEILDSF